MYTFTDDEIETIKNVINEHGSDCPGTDSNKVKELEYKLGLSIRPTPEEIAAYEVRMKAWRESPYGKQISEMLVKRNKYIAQELIKDNVFFSSEQWDKEDFKIGSTLRIKLPNNYIVKNTKLSLWQRLRKYLNV